MAFVQGRSWWIPRDQYRRLHYPTDAEKAEDKLKRIEEESERHNPPPMGVSDYD